MSNKNTKEKKVVSIKIKDLQQLKIILSTWYSYLINKTNNNKLEQFEFQEAIKTPILYNLEKDELELLLYGTEEMLKDLNSYIENINLEILKKKNQ